MWKCAMESITGLKNIHGLQLALHLPESSETCTQILDTLDINETCYEKYKVRMRCFNMDLGERIHATIFCISRWIWNLGRMETIPL